MLSFAFMHPQAIRLLLDRSKFDGIVLPTVALKASSTVQSYTEALGVTRRQIPVFIYPDLQTLITIVRSGAFDVSTGKHILCASISVLARYQFDPLDASPSESIWRVRANLSTILNSALLKDTGLEDEVVERLLQAPELPEQKFSNPIVKVEEKPCIEFSELSMLLGSNEQKASILHALLRYVTWSFVADQASRLGTTSSEIVKAANAKLTAANNKAFAQYVKDHKLKIPVNVLARVRTMFRTSVASTMITFAVRRLGSKRPYSIALAESGCLPSNAAFVEASGLTVADFPKPSGVSLAPARVVSHNMTGLTTTVQSGTYSFTQLLHIIGERVDHAFDVVRRTQSPIVFSRNPTWRDNDNCWEIKTGSDFVMLYNGVKYRFCTEDSLMPAPVNKVTADSPKIVIRKRPKPAEAAKATKPTPVPAPKRKEPKAQSIAVPAPRKRATVAQKAIAGPAGQPAVKTLTKAQAKKLLPAPVAARVVAKRERTASKPVPAPTPVKAAPSAKPKPKRG